MKRRGAAAVLVTLLAATPAFAQQGDPLLAQGIRQVEDGSLDDAIATLDSAIGRLSGLEGRRQELARAHLYKGIAAAQLGLQKVAQAAFRKALALDGSLTLSPERWPRTVDTVFSAVKAETVPATGTTRPAPGPATGPRTAPVDVVVYSGYLCPFSRKFAQLWQSLPESHPSWGDRVALEVRHYPLDQACNPAVTTAVHPGSCALATGAICARRLGRFQRYHLLVFSSPPPNASLAEVQQLGAAAGLDPTAFAACLVSQQTREELAGEIARGQAAGVNGTPTVLVNGTRVANWPVDLVPTIEGQLAGATGRNPQAAPAPPTTAAPADLGIDTVVVRGLLAVLREGASSAARVVKELPEGAVLALVSREASGGFYRVIEIESGQQGFIRAEDVQVRLTAQPRAASPFQAARVDDKSPPTVSVTNDSDKMMTLTLGAEAYTIAAHSERTITLQPGRVSYVASAPNVIPAIGTQQLDRGYTYTWRFWIEQQ